MLYPIQAAIDPHSNRAFLNEDKLTVLTEKPHLPYI